MLLQATIDGMTDVSFTLKDVFYICGLLGSALGGFFSLKAAVKSLENRFNNKEEAFKKEIENLQGEVLATKLAKKAMRVELKEFIEKKEDVTHRRIDAVRDDLKEYRKSSDVEFKEINKNMSEVKNSTSKIEGMLTQLLNQK